MDQYCAYLRKSRLEMEAEQYGEGETLATHRKRLLALAARNGHVISQFYEEIVSGETLTARPEAQRMLADVAAGKYRGCYVTEIERLARGDSMDQGFVAHAFRESRTLIITPLKTYDPQDPTDETFFEFSLFMSRQEFKAIRRRMQAGIQQSFSEGKYVGSRPAYGYRKVKLPREKGYTLAIHEEEAAIIRKIFDWYLHGLNGRPAGLTIIANHLMDIHAPTGEQGTTWRPPRIHRILTNPTYAGYLQRGRCKTIREATPSGIVKKRVMLPEGDRVEGLHPAIISREVYEAAQDKLHARDRHVPVRRGAQIRNPFTGIMVCAECGHGMAHLPACGRQPAMIYCRIHGCPTVRTYCRPVEEAVLDTLRTWLTDPGSVSTPPSVDNSDVDLLRSALDHIAHEVDTITRQISRIQDLLEQGVYTVAQYAERYALHRDRLDTLAADRERLTQQLASMPVYCTPQELAPSIVHLLDHYDQADAIQKNELLRSCISKIVYSKSIRGYRGIDPNQFRLDIYPRLK